MASISLKNVVKRYGHGKTAVPVLHGINAEISDREFIVIVGPSGCGKSTLLRMVAGLEEISGGDIAIGGRVVNNLEPAERDIAMVFQNYALYPHMTVFDNMAYGLKIKKVPIAEIKVRVDKAAKILELGHLLERKPRELSGGQRQRVALARALAGRPGALLLDEPFSALDPALRQALRSELDDLQRRLQLPMVLITHDPEDARQLGEHIIHLQDGRVLREEFAEVAPSASALSDRVPDFREASDVRLPLAPAATP